MFNLGDRVKVKSTIDQDETLGSSGLSSRYGHVIEHHVPVGHVEVKFHDFSANIPAKYLTLIEAAK